MVDAIASTLLERLLTLLDKEGQLQLGLDAQFAKMKNELSLMRSYVKDADEVKKKGERHVLKTLVGRLREHIYDAEDVIEDCQILSLKQHKEHVPNCISSFSPQYMMSRRKITKCLMKINQEIEDVKKDMVAYMDNALTTTNREMEEEDRLRFSHPISINEEEIVGLDEDTMKLRKWILEATGPKTVIGIVGMGGSGKTTLARKIYNDHDVKSTYERTIFQTVSQSFILLDILKKMLLQINVDKNVLEDKGVDQLLDVLKSHLEDKKYLVVLDDVWQKDDGRWDNLNNALPKRKGCCVIVTTREKEVARSMGATEKHIHTPKILSDDDSWSLFVKIAFASSEGGRRSPELEIVAKEIVAKCEGLPLAIKVVGGMMRGKGRSIDKWKRISMSLKEELGESTKGEMVMSRLKLSYEELPTYLRPCLLYFSMYPEDYLIYTSDIIYQWIGEGFVSAKNGETAFQVGENCIGELINRCLIVGAKRDLFQRNFTCYEMHDMVREMVINIARDENFTSLDKSHRPVFSVFSRRVCISGNSETEGIRSKVVKKLRTLVGFDLEEKAVLNIKPKLCELKRLRVLRLDLSETLTGAAALGKDWLDGIEGF